MHERGIRLAYLVHL